MPAASAAPLSGLRLQRMLESILEARGVELVLGEADAPDGTPDSLRARDPAPSIPDPSLFDAGRGPRSDVAESPAHAIRAGAVVLATGRFVGGGVERRGAFREPIFDLPIAVGGGEAWIGALTDPSFAAGQAAFAAGVRVDAALRPIDRDGRPRARNLFACGSILAGNDPARDGAGLGLSWCTGWLAGLAAAEVV